MEVFPTLLVQCAPFLLSHHSFIHPTVWMCLAPSLLPVNLKHYNHALRIGISLSWPIHYITLHYITLHWPYMVARSLQPSSPSYFPAETFPPFYCCFLMSIIDRKQSGTSFEKLSIFLEFFLSAWKLAPKNKYVLHRTQAVIPTGFAHPYHAPSLPGSRPKQWPKIRGAVSW